TTPVNIIDDKTDSNLTNEETGSQDDFNLADNIWNTGTEELQKPNNQVLQTINESDNGWNTDILDELQESNLLTLFSEIIQLGSCGSKETTGQVKYRLEFEENPEIANMDSEKAYKIFVLKIFNTLTRMLNSINYFT
ncbi:304_t:CDS:2, partial [Dentiscutata erythropus]